jgi:predicted NACHT family NTPase
LGFADDETLYGIRNYETHNDAFLEQEDYFAQLRCVICWYFRFVDKHYDALWRLVHPIEPYFEFLSELQRVHQSAFVDLELQEHIRVLAREQLAPEARQVSISKTVLELQAEVWRRRKQVQMMLLGAAGMGKTMSLLELVMREVNDYRRGRSVRIPMYLQLSDYDTALPLEAVCEAQLGDLGVSLPLREWMLAGKVSLYLDGLNEVLESERPEVVKRLQAAVFTYPAMPMMIASRPAHYFDIPLRRSRNSQPDDKLLAFSLQEMQMEQIETFVQRNFQGDKPALLARLRTAPKDLLRDLKNPLLMGEFLRTYQPDAPLPESDEAIIEKFLKVKYNREAAKNPAFDPEFFDEMIRHYAEWIGNHPKLGYRNPQVTLRQLLDCFQNTLFGGRFDGWLKSALDLTILVRDPLKNKYFFAHQSYQDHYSIPNEF